MEEDLKLLIGEIQVIQKEYESYALNIEQRIEKFKIEGNELLCELKDEVAKTEEILYLLGDRLKKGTIIFEQIKNLDDKIFASDLLTMLKDTCMDFKDFAINHNALTKGKAQVIMDKNMNYMETSEAECFLLLIYQA